MVRYNLAGLALSTTVTAMFLAGCSGSSQVGNLISPISPDSQRQGVSRAPVHNAQSGSVLASPFDPASDKGMTYLSTIGGYYRVRVPER